MVISWLLVIFSGLLAIPTAILCLQIVGGPCTAPSSNKSRPRAWPAHRRLGAGAQRECRHCRHARGHQGTAASRRPSAGRGRQLHGRYRRGSDDYRGRKSWTARIPNGSARATRWTGVFGISTKDPPDIVVMIDADCRLAEGSIGRLTGACSMTWRPVQALYLMTVPDGSRINKQIAAFAWRVKNWVRPLGLGGLGLPCQMVGTGMAFPWPVIRTADLASGWIVEDLKLGLDLAAAGHPPLFCPSARVTSQFAASARGADIQRSRWEHGHIMTILKLAPRMLCIAITRANFSLLALTLDLAVPPLSLLALLLILMFAMTGVAALLGVGSSALIISTACLVGFATTVGLAWNSYGRDVLPARAISSVPFYILAKLGLYGQILFGKMTAQWIRTDRTKT